MRARKISFVMFVLLAAFLAFGLCACSMIRGKAPATGSQADQSPARSVKAIATTSTKVPVEELEKDKKDSLGLELVWAMPNEPVDGFVIHYGLHKESLDKQLTLKSNELEKMDDPDRGQVYRYVVKDVPADQPVFVGISAFAGQNSSPISEVREVAP
jgi:hypothetical protein